MSKNTNMPKKKSKQFKTNGKCYLLIALLLMLKLHGIIHTVMRMYT